MKRLLLPLLLVMAWALLTACGGKSAPAPEPAPAPVPVTQPAPEPIAVPAVQEGLASDEFMEEGLQKVRANAAAFGEFFAAYLTENADSMFTPDEYKPFNTGRLFDVEIPVDAEPAGQNKVLITYDQLANVQTGFRGNKGVFLDCMALLPIEQIPDSLLVYDKLIRIIVEPVVAFKYGSGLPAIRWDIGVTCLDIASGETASGFFSGGAPPDVAWAKESDRYIDGPFPLDEAVAYGLELAATATGEPLPEPAAATASMRVYSDGVINDVIEDEYAMRGQQQKNGVPTRSLPLKIVDAPPGTVCFALIMRDPDSEPLCGYAWTHWLAANFTAAELDANASIDMAADMVQGQNDFGGNGYGGPTPPDRMHTYTIVVYALDAELPLTEGFSVSQLEEALKGHILDMATLDAIYSP